MPMINCPECGKEISDLASACPNCGFPMGFEATKVNQNYGGNVQNQHPIIAVCTSDNKEDEKSKIWDILSAITLVIFPLAPIGIAIMWIKKVPKSFVVRILGTAVFGLAFLIWFATTVSDTDKGNEIVAEKEIEESFAVENESKEKEKNNQILEETEQETHVEKSVEEGEKEIDTIEYEDVFFYDLMDNIDYYNGKYIRTVIQVSSCYENDDKKYIRSQYSDYDLSENRDDITVYPDNYRDFEYGEYITVEGRIAKDGNNDVLANAHIVNHGDEARKTFEDGLAICKEEYNKKLMSQRETFIESCTEVSYEDLRRYPDTYKDKPIKLKIYAKDVEPDGWIFPGDIIATYQGEELAVYDGRAVREPRILEGDTITVYAVGYGLSKMQIKQKGLVFNKTVDEYDVPAIQIKYTENDNVYYEKSVDTDETNLYDAGKDAGEKLNEGLDSNDWDENKEKAREAGEKAADFINNLIE